MKTINLKPEVRGDVATLRIPFRNESVAFLVDAADLPAIISRCSAIHVFEPKPGKRYIRVYRNNGEQTSLHRLLLGLANGDKRVGDHKSNDSLDYRRENLRTLKFEENCMNRTHARTDSQTGIRGVHRHEKGWIPIFRGKRFPRCLDVRDAVEVIWEQLVAVDPIAATNYLRTLPAA